MLEEEGISDQKLQLRRTTVDKGLTLSGHYDPRGPASCAGGRKPQADMDPNDPDRKSTNWEGLQEIIWSCFLQMLDYLILNQYK